MDAPAMDRLPHAEALPSATGFDYEQLDDAAANQAKAVVERYRGRVKAYVIDTGRDLIGVKERLDHGLFQEWVTSEMGLKPRTAQNFMQAAAQLGHKSEIVSHLPPTVIYKLAAPSTPEPVRARILERLEAGETIASEVILHEVHGAREEARAMAAAKREKVRRAKLCDEQRVEEDALRGEGEKREIALAQKEERERIERGGRQRQDEAEAGPWAEFLVRRVGAEDLAVLFERFGPSLGLVLPQAAKLAHAQRAQTQPVVELPVDAIDPSARLSNYFPLLDKVSEARELAALTGINTRNGGRSIKPIVVMKGPRSDHYDIVDGASRFRALADLLKHPTIPVRIVPPVDPERAAAIGSED